jgi:hypothetical protein
MPVKSASATSPDSWNETASMQVERSGLGVAAVNGKIYAIGGTTYSGGSGDENGPLPSTGGAVGTNEMYDPQTDTWVFKASLPTPRADFATAVFENKIYCIGGSGGVNEVYDPQTDTWENKTAMPTPRKYLQANIVGDKIYLIGGFVPDTRPGYEGSGDYVGVNEVYDPKIDSWTTATPMPSVTNGYTVVLDNKIHFIGGYLTTSKTLLHEIYDPKTNTWSNGAAPPSSTDQGAVAATTGINSSKRIYVFGQILGQLEGEPSNTVRVYDTVTGTWVFGTNMTMTRYGFAVAVVNDVFYVIGGYTWSYPVPVFSFPYGPSIKEYATVQQYFPFNYGHPDPSYDGTPPKIEVISPQQGTYTTTNVTLDFTLNESISSISYVLDGKAAVEITGNTTIAGLSFGTHNLTVYAADASDNTGSSETITFTVAQEPKPEPFPIIPVLIIVVACVVVAGAGFLLYRKRGRGKTQ